MNIFEKLFGNLSILFLNKNKTTENKVDFKNSNVSVGRDFTIAQTITNGRKFTSSQFIIPGLHESIELDGAGTLTFFQSDENENHIKLVLNMATIKSPIVEYGDKLELGDGSKIKFGSDDNNPLGVVFGLAEASPIRPSQFYEFNMPNKIQHSVDTGGRKFYIRLKETEIIQRQPKKIKYYFEISEI